MLPKVVAALEPVPQLHHGCEVIPLTPCIPVPGDRDGWQSHATKVGDPSWPRGATHGSDPSAGTTCPGPVPGGRGCSWDFSDLLSTSGTRVLGLAGVGALGGAGAAGYASQPRSGLARVNPALNRAGLRPPCLPLVGKAACLFKACFSTSQLRRWRGKPRDGQRAGSGHPRVGPAAPLPAARPAPGRAGTRVTLPCGTHTYLRPSSLSPTLTYCRCFLFGLVSGRGMASYTSEAP